MACTLEGFLSLESAQLGCGKRGKRKGKAAFHLPLWPLQRLPAPALPVGLESELGPMETFCTCFTNTSFGDQSLGLFSSESPWLLC